MVIKLLHLFWEIRFLGFFVWYPPRFRNLREDKWLLAGGNQGRSQAMDCRSSRDGNPLPGYKPADGAIEVLVVAGRQQPDFVPALQRAGAEQGRVKISQSLPTFDGG